MRTALGPRLVTAAPRLPVKTSLTLSHVRSRSPLHHLSEGSLKHSHLKPKRVTMHYRIPPELFDIIIDSFTEWPTFNPGLGVRMTKRELGACSLVCRYWARRCRYWIFATLSVRSREDFNDLLHLIDTAHEMDDIPPLTECIQDLQVQHAGPWTMPWFHRILKELTARGLELEPENISLEVKEAYVPEVHHSEDQTSSHYAPRSLSTSLPRTIPRSMFSHAMLALSDLRFRRVKDLLRLIDDQADLQQIAWTRLSFDAGTVVPPSRMRTRRSWESNETVSTSEWADVELEVQIMFLIASEKAEEAFAVVPEAWQAMVKASVALKLPSTYRLVLRQRGDGASRPLSHVSVNLMSRSAGHGVRTRFTRQHGHTPRRVPHRRAHNARHTPTYHNRSSLAPTQPPHHRARSRRLERTRRRSLLALSCPGHRHRRREPRRL